MFVCVCFAIREKELESIILTKRCSSLKDLERHTSAGSSCGTCRTDLQSRIAQLMKDQSDCMQAADRAACQAQEGNTD